MNVKKLFILTIIAVVIFICFNACSKTTLEYGTQNSTESFKSQMDVAMKNANDDTILAKVNDINIYQTNLDVYLISDKKYSIEDLVRITIITDFAKKNGLEINDIASERINNLKTSMENDSSISDEYCLDNYGVSKSKVIEYMVNRSEQIWLNDAFSDMVIEQVSSGTCPEIYPELLDAYNQFQTDKNSKGSKAWDDMENAYYEMIAKDYRVTIY